MKFMHSFVSWAKFGILHLIFLLFFFANAFGQHFSTRETYEEGEEFFQSEDYREAIYYFLEIVNRGYNNANVQFKIGRCYLAIPGEETKAIPYLEAASKNITLKYNHRKNMQERRAPLETLFYLGNAYSINNQLGKALDTYHRLVQSPGYNENTFNLNMVDDAITACQRAKIIQDAPVKVVFTNLGNPVNSALSETHPVVSGDEKKLVYLEGLKFYNAVYFSRKIQGVWLPPVNISPQIISDGDFYPTALSFDGTELYLVRKVKSEGDIYISTYHNGKWSPAKPLAGDVNSSRDENYASISSDGQVLYFSSNRRGTYGGYDLYRAYRKSNGEWGKAKNLGKTVNTRQDEISPSITSDGKTLYFSSKGHFNMGGFDIFYTTLQKNGKWSEPVNMGYPVNTTNDNVGFEVFENGKAGYMSRIMKDGEGKEDIYHLAIESIYQPSEKKNN